MKTTVKKTMITMNAQAVQRMALAESDLELCKMYTKQLEKQIKGYKKEVKELGKMAVAVGKDIEKLARLNAPRKYSPKFSPNKSKSKPTRRASK